MSCQKPYLTAAQVIARLLCAITCIFWTKEWLKVLWSDEVTFLVGSRTVKERVTRNNNERTYPTCIQHQFHRGHTTLVNAWGAIGYGYKSPLLFIHGCGKSGAFLQKDYHNFSNHSFNRFWKPSPQSPTSFALWWSLYLWRMVTQPTVMSLPITVVPNGVLRMELFLCLTPLQAQI